MGRNLIIYSPLKYIRNCITIQLEKYVNTNWLHYQQYLTTFINL